MLNKCIFMGRLTKDPEIKIVGEAKAASFTIAVSRRYKRKDEDKPSADFIQVTAWRSSADFAEKYFAKGKQVFVVGNLETYSYEKDGERKFSFCINASELGFAAGKRNDDSEKANQGGNNDFPDFGDLSVGDDLPF